MSGNCLFALVNLVRVFLLECLRFNLLKHCSLICHDCRTLRKTTNWTSLPTCIFSYTLLLVHLCFMARLFKLIRFLCSLPFCYAMVFVFPPPHPTSGQLTQNLPLHSFSVPSYTHTHACMHARVPTASVVRNTQTPVLCSCMYALNFFRTIVRSQTCSSEVRRGWGDIKTKTQICTYTRLHLTPGRNLLDSEQSRACAFRQTRPSIHIPPDTLTPSTLDLTVSVQHTMGLPPFALTHTKSANAYTSTSVKMTSIHPRQSGSQSSGACCPTHTHICCLSVSFFLPLNKKKTVTTPDAGKPLPSAGCQLLLPIKKKYKRA